MSMAHIGRGRTARANVRAGATRERNLARAHTAPRSNREAAARMGREQIARANAKAAANREKNLAQGRNAARINREAAARTRNERIAGATRAAAQKNLTANHQRNLTFAHNVLEKRVGNVRVTNDWHQARFNGPRYSAFYNYNQQWHDRTWWRNHYSNIVFVLGGWWYWDAGYWFPAWDYNPYAWYWYDGPIYTGYANLTPDRVMVEVQQHLAADGYYASPIDGRMGPQTRAALAAFQADNGLAVTSAIDEPTLQTLGLA